MRSVELRRSDGKRARRNENGFVLRSRKERFADQTATKVRQPAHALRDRKISAEQYGNHIDCLPLGGALGCRGESAKNYPSQK